MLNYKEAQSNRMCIGEITCRMFTAEILHISVISKTIGAIYDSMSMIYAMIKNVPKLKLVKNKLRSRMLQEWLSVVSIESDVLES